MPKVVFSIGIEYEKHLWLSNYAQEHGMTVSAVARLAINDFIEKTQDLSIEEILFNYYHGEPVSGKNMKQLETYWEQVGSEPGNARWAQDERKYGG